MGTLSSELGAHAGRIADQPRVYVDANMPAGLVAFMRKELRWDVLFVIEHDDLRRARDDQHYAMARQLRRTLITLDRDYLDDRRFPPDQGSGVVVIAAPNDRQFVALVCRLDRLLFGTTDAGRAGLPLDGRKLHAHTDWRRDER